MRLPTDEALARETIAAAARAGITVFDTAHAYGPPRGGLGHGERVLAGALRSCGAARDARIVTKGGMTRSGDGGWAPDGRAKAIRADCEASLAAIDGLVIDLYLLHTPDPRVPWRTSVRALARLADERLVARVGLANVNRRQLDEALELSGSVVAIPGARRRQTARSAARAARLALSGESVALVGRPARPARAVRTGAGAGTRAGAGGEVVLVMGIPGAGKTRVAAAYVARGYERLNRDERGGSLADVAGALDERLSAGATRIVLDNTYLSRASRSHVVEAARRHGVPVHCVWIDTPPAQAQRNLVERLLERFGALPAPEELALRARREPGLLAPTSQMRALRELEPPSPDEGLTRVERAPFVRAAQRGSRRAGVFVAAAAMRDPGWSRALDGGDRSAPALVFDWIAGGAAEDLAALVSRLASEVSGPVAGVVCPHGGGPPRCWCRPPLPGLPMSFARAHRVSVSDSVLIGSAPSHRTLARTLGARYAPV